MSDYTCGDPAPVEADSYYPELFREIDHRNAMERSPNQASLVTDCTHWHPVESDKYYPELFREIDQQAEGSSAD